MRKRIAFVVSIAALYSGAMFTTNGCGAGPRPTPMRTPVTALQGIVTDAETSQPLAGARLSIQGQRADSGADGRFAFSGLDARRSLLTAAREGYRVYQAEVVLREGQSTTHDVAMRRLQ